MDPSHIKSLFDQRQHAASELRSLYDSVEGDLTGEDVQLEERLNHSLDDYDARIQNALKGAERDSKAEAAAVEFRALHPEVFQDAKVSTAFDSNPEETMLRSLVEGTIKSAEFENRTLLTSVASGAGALIPGVVSGGNFYNRLLEYMIETSSIMAGGAYHLSTDTGEKLVMPKATSFPTAKIIAENAAVSASEPGFDTYTLGSFKYGFLTSLSQEMLRDSTLNLSAFLARVGGRALGNGFGTDMVTGASAATGTPEGVNCALSGASVAYSAVSAAATSGQSNINLFNAVIDLQHSLLFPYRAGAGFIAHDTTVKVLRKCRDTEGNFIWAAGATVGAPDRLLGAPIVVDTAFSVWPSAAANKFLLYGNLDQGYIYRTVGGVRIDRSDEYGFVNDATTFRFLLTGDGRIQDPNAIKTLVTT